MLIKEIMSKNVISVKADTKVGEISQLLTKHGIHGVPVVDNNGLILGIITESDFFIKDIPNLYLPSYIDFLMNVKFAHKIKSKEKNNINKLLDAKAEDIMTKDCILISAGDPIEDLINIFRSKHLSTIPVVDNNRKVIGIVTLADIIKLVKLNK